MWALACMRDHFQLTALCSSWSNKYLFIGHFCGKGKLLLVRDSQFLFSLAQSREINICSGLRVPRQPRAHPHFLLSLRDVGYVAFGLWLQPVAKLGDFWFLFTHFYFGCNILHGAKKRRLKSCCLQHIESCVAFTCVCAKGRAVLSSALEILFLTKNINRKVVFAHSKNKFLPRVPLCLIFFSYGW